MLYILLFVGMLSCETVSGTPVQESASGKGKEQPSREREESELSRDGIDEHRAFYRQGPTKMDPWLQRFFAQAQTIPSSKAKRSVETILADPEKYRFQLIVTEVINPSSEQPTVQTHEYRVDQEYFYPASAIKLFGSLASLMHWTKQKERYPWLSPDDSLNVGRKQCWQSDESNVVNGLATLEHEIKKTQLVSSNSAFNRVFDSVGMDSFHSYILPMFPSVRVYHRLSSTETPEERVRTPSMQVCDVQEKERTWWRPALQATRENAPIFPTEMPYTGFGENTSSLQIGKAYIDSHSKKQMAGSMDFTEKNRASFYDFHRAMVAFQYSNVALPWGSGLDLSSVVQSDWLDQLRHAMTLYPHDSLNPVYTDPNKSETRFKPLISGIRQTSLTDRSLLYRNKAGKAFGFHMDNAFIAYGSDVGVINKQGYTTGTIERALFITVGVYVNQNNTLNDNRYEYETLSLPFLQAMGYAAGVYLLSDH